MAEVGNQYEFSSEDVSWRVYINGEWVDSDGTVSCVPGLFKLRNFKIILCR